MKSSPCSYIGLRAQTSGNTTCQQESLVTQTAQKEEELISYPAGSWKSHAANSKPLTWCQSCKEAALEEGIATLPTLVCYGHTYSLQMREREISKGKKKEHCE